jgi:hypothetical protein
MQIKGFTIYAFLKSLDLPDDLTGASKSTPAVLLTKGVN